MKYLSEEDVEFVKNLASDNKRPRKDKVETETKPQRVSFREEHLFAVSQEEIPAYEEDSDVPSIECEIFFLDRDPADIDKRIFKEKVLDGTDINLTEIVFNFNSSSLEPGVKHPVTRKNGVLTFDTPSGRPADPNRRTPVRQPISRFSSNSVLYAVGTSTNPSNHLLPLTNSSYRIDEDGNDYRLFRALMSGHYQEHKTSLEVRTQEAATDSIFRANILLVDNLHKFAFEGPTGFLVSSAAGPFRILKTREFEGEAANASVPKYVYGLVQRSPEKRTKSVFELVTSQTNNTNTNPSMKDTLEFRELLATTELEIDLADPKDELIKYQFHENTISHAYLATLRLTIQIVRRLETSQEIVDSPDGSVYLYSLNSSGFGVTVFMNGPGQNQSQEFISGNIPESQFVFGSVTSHHDFHYESILEHKFLWHPRMDNMKIELDLSGVSDILSFSVSNKSFIELERLGSEDEGFKYRTRSWHQRDSFNFVQYDGAEDQDPTHFRLPKYPDKHHTFANNFNCEYSFGSSVSWQTGQTIDESVSFNMANAFSYNQEIPPDTYERWELSEEVPSGLSIDPDTGALSGTLTQEGSGRFRVYGYHTTDNLAVQASIDWTVTTQPTS